MLPPRGPGVPLEGEPRAVSGGEGLQIQMELDLSTAHLLRGLVPNRLCMGTVLFCDPWIGDAWVIGSVAGHKERFRSI